MSDEGYNVKDIIKRNIASARKDAAGLKRPRGPEGKPPEMGSGFMQKRKDAAAKIKAGRKELASQTENFITRTVGMLFDRLTEEMKPSLAQRAVAAAKKRPGATVTKTDAGREVVEAPPKNPKKQTTLLATDKKGGVTIDTGKKTRDLASHQFINNTVEILMERIKANKAAKNAWMAKQPTNPDNEPKIPKRYKSEAEEDVAGAVQFNATSRSQHNVPKHSKTNPGAGHSGKPFDDKSNLTAARTVKKHTTNPLMSAVNAKHARSNKAYQAKRDDASHQNFIGKTVEILAEKLIGNQHEIDADGDKKITRKDFKILRSGKKKGK